MKTLKDIVTEVQEVTGLSKSELSRRIGKSRNYLVSVVKAGLTYDNEKALIQNLHAVAEQEYDEFEKLRQNLEIAEEKIIERNEDFRKLSKKYKDSEHKVVMLQKQIDQLKYENRNQLANNINSEGIHLFQIEQQGKLISELYHKLDDLETAKDSQQALSDAGFALGEQLHQERIKNRFLTGGILFVFVVSAVYLGFKAYGH
ncbi:MAG: hypothetical protein [Caudoviricetes sp.]|nr:MAG: hypothetical protein [Caudoviricetes sp.]